MNIKDLQKKVVAWAGDRKILSQATPESQALKTLSEAKELVDAKTEDEAKGAIGDTLVTLIIGAEMRGLTLEECLQAAWDEIKDRQGMMVHGLFVKQGSIDSMASAGIRYDEKEQCFSAKCKAAWERDQAIAAMNSNDFTCASKYYSATGWWIVKTTGISVESK